MEGRANKGIPLLVWGVVRNGTTEGGFARWGGKASANQNAVCVGHGELSGEVVADAEPR